MPLLFAYGSLLADAPDAARATLGGHVLTWGVAMDNRVDLPGYKAYEDVDGSRPPVAVCFLDVRARRGSEVEGVVLEVAAADLAALDARERNYARHDLPLRGGGGRARAWIYVGRAMARERAARGRGRSQAVVARAYLDLVTEALARHGLLPPPIPPGVRVAELRRRELP